LEKVALWEESEEIGSNSKFATPARLLRKKFHKNQNEKNYKVTLFFCTEIIGEVLQFQPFETFKVRFFYRENGWETGGLCNC